MIRKTLMHWLGSKQHKEQPVQKAADEPQATPLYSQLSTDWLYANWEGLTAITEAALQHDPQRAELAVWVGAAHMQQGQHDTAQQFLAQAQAWGVNSQVLARALSALAHQSLGAAYVSQGSTDKALLAYQQALALGGCTAFIQQALQRIQQTQGNAEAGHANVVSPSASQLRALQQCVDGANDAMNTHLNKQDDELIRVRKHLESVVKKEVTNASKQIQSFVAVQHYLETGQLPAVSTEFNMWPISPDFSLYLVRLLEAELYDVIIEFGSGYSTEMIARALQKQQQCHPERHPTVQIAFEHDQGYYEKTRKQLQVAGLERKVVLQLASLTDWHDLDGKKYLYYNAEAVAKTLAEAGSGKGLKVLVVVDGPPAGTGVNARYPALPVVMAAFGQQEVHFLMDDYIRDDEKAIVETWQERLGAMKRNVAIQKTRLEKDACLIRINAL